MKRRFRDLVIRWVQKRGMIIRDARTGDLLGRALLIPWGGKIHVIGLDPVSAVTPYFLPQERLTYWKQELGFVGLTIPDYPHESHTARDSRPQPAAYPSGTGPGRDDAPVVA